jgi:hypothetical protein
MSRKNRHHIAATAIVLLVTSTAAIADGDGTNLLSNGGFETGDLTGWTNSSQGGILLGMTTGYAGYEGTFLFQSPTGANGSLHASLPTIASGTQLCIEFDLVSSNAFGTLSVGQSVPFIGFLNDIAQVSLQSAGGSTMTRYAFTFTANDGVEAIGFEWNALPGGSFAIDNVSLSVVPAPGAAAILGLAGLVGRRRR